MQAYGVPPEFVVARSTGPSSTHHMFSISPHDQVAAVAAAAAAHHRHHLQTGVGGGGAATGSSRHQLHHHHHQQQQQQQQVVQQLGLSPDSVEAPSPIATRPSPTGSGAAYKMIGGDEEMISAAEERGIGGNRWPRQETLALIRIRTEMDANFRDSGLKAPLWEEVSRRLAELGFQRSAKKCKEKFENVHKYYKKTKGGKAGRQDGKCYRFFAQLEALYGSNFHGAGTVGGGGAALLQAEDHNNGSFLLSGSAAAAAAAMTTTTTTANGAANSSGQRFSENSDGTAANLFSDTDEDEEDGYDDPDREDKRKRKRKSWASQMIFFESLVRKFMDRQDSMHRKFLEAIDRREQERLLKDDAWRKQELGRIQREQDLRTQERSQAATRDAALVAFLQKVTGQTLQLPQALATKPQHGEQNQLQEEQNQKQKQNQQQQQQQDIKEHFDPNSKRWPKQEVHALIRLRSGMETRFQEPGAKGPLWEEISSSMGHMGYNRSSKRCKEKWENINKYFRKTKDSSKKRSENSKTCPYFEQLDTLYRTGVLTPPNSRGLADQAAAANELQERLSGHREEDSPEMLAIMPLESGPAGETPAPQFYSSSETGDGSSQQQQQQQKQSQQSNEKQNSGGMDASRHMVLSLIGIHHAGGGSESFPGAATNNNGNDIKSARAGSLVDEIMDDQQQRQPQQQQQQMSIETTAATATATATREAWQQQQLQQQRTDKSGGSGCSKPPSSKDAALIALVHKLTGQASPVDMPLGVSAAAAAAAGSNSG